VPETKTFRAEGGEGRLDKYLAWALRPMTRTYVQKLISDGLVTLNGRPTPAGKSLIAGDEVTVAFPEFSALPAAASAGVPILFEDSDLIVVDKPAGVVVHPAGPHQEDTLVQRLWPKLEPAWKAKIHGVPLHTARPGVVHRLDKGTSGIILIAKNPAAAENLSSQFEKRKVEKIYWALAEGSPGAETGTIRSNVGRDRHRPDRMSVTDPGRPSELEFKVLARFERDALLEVHPLTGRTHQIRVQLASVGHPLVGDGTYGNKGGDRPLLHALRLSFNHPRTKKRLTFSAPLPEDFRAVLAERGFDAFPSKKVE